jgi:hypothetical protein
MQNALDAFRAQREAADQVHARLTEVAQLLEQLTKQVDAVAGDADLRAVLRDERDWLRQAQQLLVHVRHFREQERLRFWPGVWRRWVMALLFALASAAAAGAGYAWWTEPCAGEMARLRARAEFPDVFTARRAALTPSSVKSSTDGSGVHLTGGDIADATATRLGPGSARCRLMLEPSRHSPVVPD